MLNKVDELCRHNTNFQSSLVVSLLKAAVENATPLRGSNSKTNVIVLNFICFIGTYDKKVAQVVSTNIGGPGDRWVRKMNARERKDCIIDRSEENKQVSQRMETSIKRRNMQGDKRTFYLAIEATKVAQVLEFSHAHGAIIGWE